MQNLVKRCEKGDLAGVKALVEKHNPAASEMRTALRGACLGGAMPVADWIWKNFKMTAEDLRAYDNLVLVAVCRDGHLEVVRWLREVVGLTTEDARTCDERTAFQKYSSALSLAACWGHTRVVEYLITGFGLTADDVRANNYTVLEKALEHRNFDIVNLMYTKFPGIREEAFAKGIR